MGGFEPSIMVGFLLGSLSVGLVYYINGRSTQKEKKITVLLLKRAKRD